MRRPPLDTRDYRHVTLPNGLRAVVVSDPRTDMAAAALNVAVGQFHDPPDREGLAHFLEHMLFMGTDRYPAVDDYRRFVQDHGGSTNAGTGQEDTRYFFKIEHGFLEGALDRFARFFCAPRLDPVFVDRERNAVDSEYRLKIRDDARRFREVRRATANPAHGFAKFSVGDAHTLADRDGRPVWDDLRAFWQTAYSASRMTLCVVGREPVDVLAGWVAERFAEVPSDGAPRSVQAVAPYLPEQLAVRVGVTPLVDARSVRIEFPTRSDRALYRERPLELLSFLVGQEGEGSLHAALRSRGWITALSTSRDGAEDHRLFVVRLGLTERGWAHRDDAIDLVFQYLRRVRAAPTLAPWFDELARIARTAFANHQPPPAMNAARALSARMQHVPSEHLLDQPWSWGTYDHALVHDFLARMVPANARVFEVGPGLATDRTEPRYAVPWTMAPLSADLLARWADGPIAAELTLPAPNRYLAERLDLWPVAAATEVPALVHEAPGQRLWHHPDTSFGVPRATFRASLALPAAVSDLRARVLAVLAVSLLRDALAPRLDPIGRAGVNVGLAPTTDGLFLQVAGYDDKLPAVLDAVVSAIRGLVVDPARVAVEQERVLRRWRNAAKDYPVRQVSWAANEVLDPADYTFADGIAALSPVTADDVAAYVAGLWAGGAVEVLAHGNLRAATATAMTRRLWDGLGIGGAVDWPAREIRRIPGHTVTLDVDIEHDDTALVVTWQADDPSVDAQARWLMLGACVRTPFFSDLRTDKQLGYTVSAGYDRRDRVPGLRCALQSPVAGPDALLGHVDRFMGAFGDTLRAMPADRFGAIRDGVLAQLREKDDTLYTRTARFARDLDLGVTTFDRRARLAAAVERVEADALADLHAAAVVGGGRLVVRSVGRVHGVATAGHGTRAAAIGELAGVFSRRRSDGIEPAVSR